jgi:hypothetical protein
MSLGDCCAARDAAQNRGRNTRSILNSISCAAAFLNVDFVLGGEVTVTKPESLRGGKSQNAPRLWVGGKSCVESCLQSSNKGAPGSAGESSQSMGPRYVLLNPGLRFDLSVLAPLREVVLIFRGKGARHSRAKAPSVSSAELKVSATSGF